MYFMFEKFLSGEARNFRQRYQGSYGFFRKNGIRHLVKLIDIVSDGPTPFVKFVNKDGSDFSLNADAEGDIGFEFLPPRSCWKNTSSFGAVLSLRIAHRQYIRGIHENNTAFTIPGVTNIKIGFPILSELFLINAPLFDDTYKSLTKNYTFSALSDSFALDTKNKTVYLFDKIIGSYKETDMEFTVFLNDRKMFGTEITDAFTRNNLKVEVK